MDFEQFLKICNYLGLISFAISGALKGVRKRLDAFGVVFLGIITSVGGGIIRDTMVGDIPSILLTPNILYFAIFISCLVLLFTGKLRNNIYFLQKPKISRILYLFYIVSDSIGLVLFSIVGANKSISLHLNLMTSGILATLTGIGGGMLRDLLVLEIPTVMRADVYATLAFFIGIVYHVCIVNLKYNNLVVTSLLLSIGLIIRLLVIKYKINMPK